MSDDNHIEIVISDETMSQMLREWLKDLKRSADEQGITPEELVMRGIAESVNKRTKRI